MVISNAKKLLVPSLDSTYYRRAYVLAVRSPDFFLARLISIEHGQVVCSFTTSSVDVVENV